MRTRPGNFLRPTSSASKHRDLHAAQSTAAAPLARPAPPSRQARCSRPAPPAQSVCDSRSDGWQVCVGRRRRWGGGREQWHHAAGQSRTPDVPCARPVCMAPSLCYASAAAPTWPKEVTVIVAHRPVGPSGPCSEEDADRGQGVGCTAAKQQPQHQQTGSIRQYKAHGHAGAASRHAHGQAEGMWRSLAG